MACDGCPPLAGLAERFANAGGHFQACPVCFDARKLEKADLAENSEVAGTVPLFDWLDGEAATVFSY